MRALAIGLAWATGVSALTIACMGDSITDGGAGGTDKECCSYPAILDDLLDFADVINYGSGGRTVVRDKAYRYDQMYYDALDHGFDVALINLGTNDATYNPPRYWQGREEFVEQYKVTVAGIVDNASPRAVFFGYPPPLSRDSDCYHDPPGRDEDGNCQTWIRELIHDGDLRSYIDEVAAWLADEYDVYVGIVDFFGALGGDDADADNYHDEVHPNENGNAMMAAAAAAVLAAWHDSDAAGTYEPTYEPTPRPVAESTPRPVSDEPTPRPESECIDDATWFHKKPQKNCAWVAAKSKRCKKKGTDGTGAEVKAKKACRVACGKC